MERKNYWSRLTPEQGGRFADPVGPSPELVAQIRACLPGSEKPSPETSDDSRHPILVGRKYKSNASHVVYEVVSIRGTDVMLWDSSGCRRAQDSIHAPFWLKHFSTLLPEGT